MAARQDMFAAIFALILTGGLFLAFEGTPARAAMLPKAALSVLWLFSATLLLRSAWRIRRGTGSGDGASRIFANPGLFAISGAAFMGYALMLRPLGFYTSSALFLAILIPALGYRRPVAIALLVAGFLIGFWLIFEVLFGRALPREFFEASLNFAGARHG